MWVFTTFGYFSVIQHNKDPELLLIRARVKGDLEKLKEKYLPNLGDVVETKLGADYPYRALAWKVDFSNAMAKMAMEIDYTNFKSEVAKKQDWPRHDLYMKVWGIMKQAESTLRVLEKQEKDRYRQSDFMFSGSGFWDVSDDGKHVSFKKGSYKQSLDFDKSRKARNQRLAKGSKVLRDELREEREEVDPEKREKIEALVKQSLKGVKKDFDQQFEEDSIPFGPMAEDNGTEPIYGLDPEDLANMHIEPGDVGLDEDDSDN